MDLRFYLDAQTGEPHIYGHEVSEDEVQDVLERPLEDRLRVAERASRSVQRAMVAFFA